MKTLIQLRLEVYEGQHDALITFYETYPKVFVNKLLLRICEAFLPKHKPSLALYEPNRAPRNGPPKKICVRLSQEKCPALWDFYMGIDYGCRSYVLVNLMERYVQLLEANRGMLDEFHWKGQVAGPDSQPLPAPVSDLAGGREKVSALNLVAQPSNYASAVSTPGTLSESQPSAPAAEDPLSGLETGL